MPEAIGICGCKFCFAVYYNVTPDEKGEVFCAVGCKRFFKANGIGLRLKMEKEFSSREKKIGESV